MPFVFIYYSERKKRKERLLRKEERKELGRGRVSSDPQRSGGDKNEYRYRSGGREERESIATRADVTLRARSTRKKYGASGEEEEKEGKEKKNAIAFRGWKS